LSYYLYVPSSHNVDKLRSSDGSSVWRYTSTGTKIGSVAVNNRGDLYIGMRDGHLRKLNSSGSVVWTSSQLSTGNGYFTATNDITGYAYISDGDLDVHKFTSTGGHVWENTDPTASYETFSQNLKSNDEGTLYFPTFDQVTKINSSGTTVWQHGSTMFPSSEVRFAVPDLSSGDHYYAGLQDNRIAKYKSSNSSLIWISSNLGSYHEIWDIALSSNHVYVFDAMGYINKFTSTGGHVWEKQLETSLYSGKISSGETAFTGLSNSKVQAVTSSGSSIWSKETEGITRYLDVDPGNYQAGFWDADIEITTNTAESISLSINPKITTPQLSSEVAIAFINSSIPLYNAVSQKIDYKDLSDGAYTTGVNYQKDEIGVKRVWHIQMKYLRSSQYNDIESHLRNNLFGKTDFWLDEFGGTPETDSVDAFVDVRNDERVQFGTSVGWESAGRNLTLEIVEA